MRNRTRPHTLTGDIRVHQSFPSASGQYDRTVLVYLPPGYDATEQRYPVLYLHDGQNVFDQATAFADEWGVDETAQQLIATGQVEPLIIVAISNAGDRRVDEYTPTVNPAGVGGGADIYGCMVVEDLKPFIDATYRTRPDVTNTAMGGSSLGGLVTLYLGLRHPTTFGKLAVLSPSVWWDDGAIVREVERLPSGTSQRIWLDTGTREGADVVPSVRRLRDALVAKGWSIAAGDLMYFEARGGEHNERSWAKRVGPFLKFLFPSISSRHRTGSAGL